MQSVDSRLRISQPSGALRIPRQRRSFSFKVEAIVLAKRLFFTALAMSVGLYIAACGGGSHSSATTQTNPPVTIGAVTLPTGYVGANYTPTTFAASGGSGTGYTWSVSGTTSLPAGMTLSSGGVISGKPTADGTTNFSVKVTDSAGATTTAQVSITIKPGVSITNALALPDAYTGSSYSQTLTATGGTGSGYTWAVAGSSTLPAGLTLSAAGTLSGKPTAAGAASFSLTVTDSAQNTATAQFSANIRAGISITTPSALPAAYIGLPYAEQLSATGGSGTGYTWSLAPTAAAVRPAARRMASAGLPSGLTLSSDGWITGTAAGTGNFTATVIVTDSASNTASIDISISIAGGITITTPSALPSGNQGDLYSQIFSATGGSGSGYTWTVKSGTTLPGGLRLSADGTLSGNLPAANSYSFGLTVTDSADNTASASFTLNVVNPVRFSTASTLTKTYAGVNYQMTFAAKGGSGHGYVFTLSAQSSLPPGLTLTTAGVLSGKATTAATYTFNVTVEDSASHIAAADFTLTVGAGVTLTTPPALPAATEHAAYTQTLAATGGSGSGYLWTLTSGGPSLSAVGLAFSNGVVSGTPTTTGTATFSISVTDTSLTYASGTFTVAVNASGTGFTVSGQVRLVTNCSAGISVPAINLAITASGSSTPLANTTTASDGSYSFNNIPNGTYSIQPAITQGTAVFSPNSYPTLTVSGASVSGQDFGVVLGFNVTGTVSYTGSLTGPIYVTLVNNTCSGDGGFGTAFTTPGGQFTIHGVAPGNYTVLAWVDALHTGFQNSNDPVANSSAAIDVSGADVTSGADVSIPDTPISAPPATNPTLANVTPTDQGVAIYYQPAINNNGVEVAASYDVQWSTDPAFGSFGSGTFKANGTGVTVWILNSATAGITGSLTNGDTNYFRARSRNSFGQTAGWSYFGTQATPTPVVIGAPSGAHMVTGTITLPAEISIAAGAPLYAGFFNESNGPIYAARINPAPGANTYSVNVPDGNKYVLFAMLDQNNDGLINTGDVSSTWARNNSKTT